MSTLRHFGQGLVTVVFFIVIGCSPTVDSITAKTSTASPVTASAAITGKLADGGSSSTITATATVSITLTGLSSNVTGVALSNNDSFVGVAPVAVTSPTATVPWTLSDGDGSKTVSAQVTGTDGSVLIVSASIVLDTEAPIWRSFAANQTYYNSAAVTFLYDAEDNLDNPSELEIGIDPTGAGDCTTLSYVPYGVGQTTYTLVAPYAASYNFNACIRDQAHNSAAYVTAGTSTSTVYFNNQSPPTPLLDPPLTGAGSVLLAWTDTSDDSQYASIDYSTDPNFATFTTVTSSTADEGSCYPRLMPKNSLLLSNLENLQTWYFRLHLVDCYGNPSGDASASALVGASTTPFNNSFGGELRLTASGNDLWAVSSGLDVDRGVWQSKDPNAPKGDVYRTLMTLYHCNVSASDCSNFANWQQSLPTQVGPVPVPEEVYMNDSGGPDLPPSHYDFGCSQGCPNTVQPARVSVVATASKLYAFAAVAGRMDNGFDQIYSGVIMLTCPTISGCLLSANWSSPQVIVPLTSGDTYDAPSAAASGNGFYMSYADSNSGTNRTTLSLASCGSSCDTNSNWKLIDSSIAVMSQTPGFPDQLSADHVFAPTLTLLGNRPYIGAAVIGPGSGPCSLYSTAHNVTPALIRCQGACASSSDLVVESLSSTANQCATPPDVAFSASDLFAAWRTVVVQSSTSSHDQIQLSGCSLASECQSSSSFSTAAVLADRSGTSAGLEDVAFLPKGAPVSSGQTLQVLYGDPNGSTVAMASCQANAQACANASNWLTSAVRTVPSDPTLVLSAVNIASEPFFSIGPGLAGATITSATLSAPTNFSALPGVGQIVGQWQNQADDTATIVTTTPIGGTSASIDISNAKAQSYAIATTVPVALAVSGVAPAGLSDSSPPWIAAPFVATSTSDSSNAAGPGVIVDIDNDTYWYRLTTTSTGLSLGRCAQSSDCTVLANWTFSTIVAGTSFAESDLSIDRPRDVYWGTEVPSSAPRLIAVAATTSGSEIFASCNLATDAAGCMGGPWSSISLGQTYHDVDSNTVFSVAQPALPSLSLSGHAWIVGHAVTVTSPDLPPPDQREDAAIHICPLGVPSPHNITAAAQRGPNTVPPASDLPDPSACATDASQWQDVAVGAGQATGASGAELHDLKVAAHPIYGYLAAYSWGNAQVTFGSTNVPPTENLLFASCPYYSVPASTDPNRNNCGTNQNWQLTPLGQMPGNQGGWQDLSLVVASDRAHPPAIPDESTGITAISYFQNQAGEPWGVAICTAGADPTFGSPWPCANSVAAWTFIPLSGAVSSPLSSTIKIVNGDLVAMFLESGAVTMAMCPLAFDCADPSSWVVNSVTTQSGFAGFASGFSADRSVGFFAGDDAGHLLIDHSLDTGTSGLFNVLGGGSASLQRVASP